MSCGSAKPKYVENGKKALESLKDTTNMKLGIQLGDYKLNFDEKYGDWRCYLN